MLKDQVHTAADIPDAPYYVTCTDKFLSGWGPCGARPGGLYRGNRNNRLIFVCETQAEAWIVYDNAKGRNDQKNVHVCTRKPKLDHYTNMYQVKTKETCDLWYEEGTW
mgnify:CR=1 FL=1